MSIMSIESIESEKEVTKDNAKEIMQKVSEVERLAFSILSDDD